MLGPRSRIRVQNLFGKVSLERNTGADEPPGSCPSSCVAELSASGRLAPPPPPPPQEISISCLAGWGRLGATVAISTSKLGRRANTLERPSRAGSQGHCRAKCAKGVEHFSGDRAGKPEGRAGPALGEVFHSHPANGHVLCGIVSAQKMLKSQYLWM